MTNKLNDAIAAKLKRLFDNWQNALKDSEQTVRQCQMKRAMFQAELEDAYRSGHLITREAADAQAGALIADAVKAEQERCAEIAEADSAALMEEAELWSADKMPKAANLAVDRANAGRRIAAAIRAGHDKEGA